MQIEQFAVLLFLESIYLGFKGFNLPFELFPVGFELFETFLSVLDFRLDILKFTLPLFMMVSLGLDLVLSALQLVDVAPQRAALLEAL